MLSLDKYDTKQSINSDIGDLVKLNGIDNKNIDMLIMNIIHKYSLGYIQLEELSDKLFLKDITELLNIKLVELYDEIVSVECRRGDNKNMFLSLKDEYRELDLFRYSLDCLMDTHATAEIFKEILLMQLNKKDNFNILELGTGSGILSLAGVLAATRSGNNVISGTGLEQCNKSILHSTNVLQQIDITRNKIHIFNKDIILPSSYDYISERGGSDLVIAEIFDHTIPKFRYDRTNKVLDYSSDNFSEFMFRNKNAEVKDPLFDGLNSLNQATNLFQNVEDNKTMLFPDVTKNHLNIKKNNGELYLESLGYIKDLGVIGDSFSEYEVGYKEKLNRWH